MIIRQHIIRQATGIQRIQHRFDAVQQIVDRFGIGCDFVGDMLQRITVLVKDAAYPRVKWRFGLYY